MTAGPTQNYSEAAGTTWRPRPVLAALVRATASLGPVLFALAVGAVASRWLPAARLGLPTAVWLLLVVAASSGVLLVATRGLRRLVPLAALLRLSLTLPDRVPSRFDVARRTWSPALLERARATGEADPGSAEWLLSLMSALAAHDARTRAHGERVQAYAALIGRELGLPRADVDRLSWVALLHDVGKVHVPAEVINKKGRPTEQEWATLQEHPDHGGRLVEPLRPWLGPWLDGVEQHHERWDGGGYPRGLAGTDLSLAARVIAVADTYDTITSARSYKKPMSAEQARSEITRCAGHQFDPEVVRAFLSVGLGRLRVVAGPATLLAALPWVGPVPAQAVSTASSVAQTAGGQVLAALLATGVGVSSGVTATHALADVGVGTVAAVHAPVAEPTARRSAGPATPSAGVPTPATTPAPAPAAAAVPSAPSAPAVDVDERVDPEPVGGSGSAPVVALD
ncbi:HD domain-containing protein, partial [Kineococcus sp. R8]|uniref:HD-GYP domain-containing protein n=1 Tax=Kineococcus siccus TaxID=2696567 RepID=UPI0014134BD2